MKKYIFSVLMAAMAAFTFSSCEDVPEPYTLPTQPGAPTTPEVATQGTEASPYTVTDAKTVKTGTGKYIKGYIVGYVPGKALNEAVFGNASSAETAPTNILLAAKADEKEVNNCMPIQLPAGDLRTALNLKDNPGNLKKELLICGNIETYFGATGLKSATYAKIDGKEIGKKPGDTTPGTGTEIKGEAKGDGSEANPFNSVAAQKYTAALEADKATDKEFYIKGKIQEIKFQYSTKYGTASVYIADDANSTKFYVFGVRYFGGEKWQEGDMTLKEGDEIVVCAKLINYMGNTPETNQGGKLISVNGKTSAGGGEVKPDPETPDTPAGGNIDMTDATIQSGKSGDVELVTNGYGSQKVDQEATWYTWKIGDITFKGAKIAISEGKNGKGIQMQGDAADATKQGFLFNATPFAKEIKTITILFSTKATSTYAPSYTFYAAKAANGKDTAIKGKSTNEVSGDFKTYTETFDLSAQNVKHFTLSNNTKGALYIEKIIITLK
ncbi:DUF6359 domain-containing protein [Segatella copri]|uniref:DUF6359 domain-containing protein n=1 Tax=Segatella copri TaxID=165179 RepID=UPI002FF387E4